MKQLIGISNNLFYNDKKEPMIEMILMIHEPDWEMIEGQPIKRQKLTEVRVFNKFETIKKIFAEFIEQTSKDIAAANTKNRD